MAGVGPWWFPKRRRCVKGTIGDQSLTKQLGQRTFLTFLFFATKQLDHFTFPKLSVWLWVTINLSIYDCYFPVLLQSVV